MTNGNETRDYDGIGRIDELIREQQRILASRGNEERRSAIESPRTTIVDRRPARRRSRTWYALVAVLLITGVVAGAALFTHSFPPTPQGTPPTLTTSCSQLVQNGPTSTIVGQPGTVLYTCSAPPSPTSNALDAIDGPATPSFTLPGMSLSIVQHSSTSTTCTPGMVLSSDIPATFTAGSYDYCVAYDFYPASGIAAFIVTWTE